MDAREQRGLIIAATCRLNRQDDGTWLVPSQTSRETVAYRVNLETKACTCLDCLDGGFVCKHYYAATIVHKRDVLPDGTVVETKSMTFTEKTVYKQKWASYNLAQTTEKHRLQVLLSELCGGVPSPAQVGKGQRAAPIPDVLFAMAFKVYTCLPSRRFMCDLADAHEKGHISQVIHYNSVCRHFENPALTPILRGLVARSALPLQPIEVDFAVDSSGFSTSRFVKWFDEKYGVTRSGHDWVKVHVMTGVKTNVVTAVEIRGRSANDAPILPGLVKSTAEHFKIREVSADKGYSSVENTEAIFQVGATPYISFKASATGAAGGLWEKMYHFFQYRREEFLQHYHKRSNVESTFSMVKAKFRDHVRAKSDVAMVNEALCKFICHNICCVIMAQCELGIEAEFWQNEPKGEQASVLSLVQPG
jgi:transposase